MFSISQVLNERVATTHNQRCAAGMHLSQPFVRTAHTIAKNKQMIDIFL
jgi:hypothetical protein